MKYEALREALRIGKTIQLNGTAVNGGYGETWNDCSEENLFIYDVSAYRIKPERKMKTNIKMRVTPEQSKAVQEICFKNNIAWHGVKAFDHLIHPYIYVYENNLGYDCKESSEYFDDHENIEIDADLFIRTNGTCEENELKDFIESQNEIKKQIDDYIIKFNEISFNISYEEISEEGLSKIKAAYEGKPIEYLQEKIINLHKQINKDRIIVKNQREELYRLNLKLQKCISFEEHHQIVDDLRKDINFRNETIKNTFQISKDRLKEIEELNKQIEKINKDNVNYLSDNILLRDKEIEKLKAVIEYLESKAK